MRRLAVLLCLAAAPALLPPSAAAQTDIPFVDAVGAWADGQTLRRQLPASKDVGKQAERRSRRQPTAKQLRTLRFTRDDDITHANTRAIHAELGEGYDPVKVDAELIRLLGLTDANIRSLGWRPTDVGDVASYVILLSYAVFHIEGEGQAIPKPASAAVRRQVRAVLARDARVRRSSDTRQQTAAEMLEFRGFLLVSAFNEARTAGDQPRIDLALAGIRAFIRDSFGLDITRVKVTRRGLVS